MRMSASSSPLSSSHFTISTMVRAGLRGDHWQLGAAIVERGLFGIGPLRQIAARKRLGQFEFDGGTGERALLNFARRAHGDDLALIHDGHAVAELFGLFDVVGGEQDGALFAAQVLHQLVDFEARLRIEAGRRLVEKQHLRIVEQGQGEGQPLLLAAGELRVVGVALFPKLQALEQHRAVGGARCRSAANSSMASLYLDFFLAGWWTAGTRRCDPSAGGSRLRDRSRAPRRGRRSACEGLPGFRRWWFCPRR